MLCDDLQEMLSIIIIAVLNSRLLFSYQSLYFQITTPVQWHSDKLNRFTQYFKNVSYSKLFDEYMFHLKNASLNVLHLLMVIINSTPFIFYNIFLVYVFF